MGVKASASHHLLATPSRVYIVPPHTPIRAVQDGRTLPRPGNCISVGMVLPASLKKVVSWLLLAELMNGQV